MAVAASMLNKQHDVGDIKEEQMVKPGGILEPENVANTKSMLSFMKGILPSYFDSEWSFAQFRLVDQKAICAIKENKIIGIS